MLDFVELPAEPDGRFGLRRFARSAGLLSLSSIANFARAVIAAKVFAVTLGPAMVGVLAQLFNFSALVGAILPVGLSSGVSKMIAEETDNPRNVSTVVLTSTVMALATGLAGALVLTPVAVPLSVGLTGSSNFYVPVLLVIWSFPLYNVGSLLNYHLQGLAAIARITRASISTTVFAVATLIPMTIAFGLTGTIASVLATSVAQVVAFSYELRREYVARGWRFTGAQLSWSVARQLLGFGWILLLSAVATWASVVAVRTAVLHSLGPHANGLYQVVFGLSNQYTTIFLAWMGAYVFPRLVAERGGPHLQSLLNSSLRANLAIMVPLLVVSIALREPLIRLFYSAAFTAAAPLIPVQVFGDYLRIVGWCFAVCLFVVGRIRAHLVVVAVQAAAWVALALILIPVLGLDAVPLAYAVSFLTYPILGIGLVSRWLHAGPDRRAWLLIVLGCVCVLGAAAPSYVGLVLVPVMPVVVYVLNRRELTTKASGGGIHALSSDADGGGCLKPQFLELIICPKCRSRLELANGAGDKEILSGKLTCAQAHEFPIVNGIPRFVETELYAQNFGFEWNTHSLTQLDTAASDESERTFTAKTGFTSELLRGKVVLDVGCGMGRFSDVVSRWGATVVGPDHTQSVDAPHNNHRSRPNVHIAQANIFELPFREATFDFIFSIGVLHHTPNTKAAFDQLPKLLRPNGRIAVWLYAKYFAVQWKFSDLYRHLTTRLPKRVLHRLSYIAVPLYYAYKIPVVGVMIRFLVPVSPHPRAEWRVLDTFDWYSPTYQWKHTYEEVYPWFEAHGLTDIRVLEVPVALQGTKGRSPGPVDGQNDKSPAAHASPATTATR
jgi:O-antigen/teichoic acid export membrane protein/SAM-dependent methyltransferase